jgi:hypothetical protein
MLLNTEEVRLLLPFRGDTVLLLAVLQLVLLSRGMYHRSLLALFAAAAAAVEELLSYAMQRSTQCTIITCMLLHAVALAENREQTLAAAAAAATRSDGTAQQNTTHITLYAVPLCVREIERERESGRESVSG